MSQRLLSISQTFELIFLYLTNSTDTASPDLVTLGRETKPTGNPTETINPSA